MTATPRRRQFGDFEEMLFLETSRSRISRIAIFVLLAFLTFPSNGDDAPTKTITILGYITCQAWTTDHAKVASGEFSNKVRKNFDEMWLIGFMSGVSATSGSYVGDPLKNVDSQIVYDWMDKYCDTHPRGDISNGGVALFEKLIDVSKKTTHDHKSEAQKIP
jgi:hypothetical protein